MPLHKTPAPTQTMKYIWEGIKNCLLILGLCPKLQVGVRSPKLFSDILFEYSYGILVFHEKFHVFSQFLTLASSTLGVGVWSPLFWTKS